jgi:hypothetical protein
MYKVVVTECFVLLYSKIMASASQSLNLVCVATNFFPFNISITLLKKFVVCFVFVGLGLESDVFATLTRLALWYSS